MSQKFNLKNVLRYAKKEPGDEKMNYEIYKPIDPQLKKKSLTFKQSKHDYTIRSEWNAEAFEF